MKHSFGILAILIFLFCSNKNNELANDENCSLSFSIYHCTTAIEKVNLKVYKSLENAKAEVNAAFSIKSDITGLATMNDVVC